jgi:hypothetical protein
VVWDSLTIDRRDAMILGVLPVRARTIVAAKLASLVAFLLLVAAAMNVPAAVAYAFDLGETETLALVVRGSDARRLGLATIDDAARESPAWRAAFTSDLMSPDAGTAPRPRPRRAPGSTRSPAQPQPAADGPTRPTAYTALARLYGLRFPQPPRTLDPPACYYALADGSVDIVAGHIAGWPRRLDLVPLTDNRHYFSPYGNSAAILVRSMVGQLAATIGAAAWVFTTLIALQGVLSVLPRRLASFCTVSFQIVFVTSLFSVLVMMPAALRASVAAIDHASGGAARSVWLFPPLWFLGIHEVALGSARPLFQALARTAFAALGLSTLAATAVVVSAYRQRLHASVAGGSGWPAAWRVAGRVKDAVMRIVAPASDTRAALEFTLITLARSRNHQLLVASYTGAAIALCGAVLLRAAGVGGVPGLAHLRVAVLWVPLVLFLFMLLGIRAAFRLPSELSGSWTFHFHAREPARVYAAATRRTALIVAVVPVLAVAFPIYAMLFGPTIAAIHVVFCALMGVGLVEWLFRRFDQIPFTRAYGAGESRDRRWWWPMAVFVLEAYAHWPVAAEIRLLQAPEHAPLVLSLMLIAVVLSGWRCRARLPLEMPLAFEVHTESALSTLDLSGSQL